MDPQAREERMKERARRRADAKAASLSDVRGLPWRRLWDYTTGVRWRFVVVGITSLIGAGAGLVFPYLIGQGIGRVVESKSLHGLNELALGLLAVFAVQALAQFVQSYFLTITGATITYRLRRGLFARLMSLDMAYFAKNKSGELASRISSDTTQVQGIFTQMLPGLLSSSAALLGTVTVMIRLNPKLTLFIFALLPLIMGIAIGIGRSVQKLSTEGQDNLAANIGLATETLKNISVVKAFTAEAFETTRYTKSLDEVLRTVMKTGVYQSLSGAAIMFLGFSSIAAIVWFAGRQAIQGTLTTSLITTFLIYGIGIAASFGQLSQLYSQLKAASGSSRRVFEILDTESVLPEPTTPARVPAGRVDLAMHEVSFSYDEAEVLHRVSLTVHSGEVVALVGPSGAGKTTVFELLQRFYDPASGKITLGGVDVRDLGSAGLRERLSVVSQNAPLFSGTVRENIAYGKQAASQPEIEAAAEAAQAHEFIRELSQGYDTILGEGGVGLSGGQRQRLSIARAIIKNAPILLLDEATSALDNNSERLVQRAIDELMKSRTTLIIAHRLTTIENADRIVVLEAGRAVESGTHQELLRKHGLYAELYGQQKQGLDSEAHRAIAT